MQVRELTIPGAWEFTPKQFGDPRGVFLEYFKDDVLAETIGHRLNLAQANFSTSAAGTVRGIHFAQIPPSQAKYISCFRGAILDVIVDIRVGSPTFGRYDTVLLDDVDRRAVYLSEGLGHAFMALEDDSVVMYLCSEGYNPGREFGIHPLDPTVGVQWPSTDRAGNPIKPLLSTKDEAAPTLEQAAAQGLLPTWDEAQEFYASLRS